MLNDIKVSIAFLTRIPINHGPEIKLHKSAIWFPLVGFFIGVMSGFSYFFLAQLLPVLPSAAISLLVSIMITGAFHFDALGDIFDGLIGGWNPQGRLEILKDSRHGTYGVVAIAFQIIFQITLISSLTPKDGALALVASHTISRIIPVILMLLPSAPNQSGMGATAAREIKYSYVLGSIFLAFLLTAPFCGLYFFGVLLTLIIPIFVFSKWVINKIGGMLGDAFGAGEQIAETIILIFFVAIFSINGSIAWMF